MDLEAVRRRHQRKASQAFADVLRAVDWHVFATVWPKRPATGHTRLLELVGGHVSAAAQAAACPYPPWIGVTETGVQGDRPHAHLLLRYPRRVREHFGPLRRRSWRIDQARRWAGNAEYREYEAGGGAAEYIAKQFGRSETELRMSRPARSLLPAGPAVGRSNSAA